MDQEKLPLWQRINEERPPAEPQWKKCEVCQRTIAVNARFCTYCMEHKLSEPTTAQAIDPKPAERIKHNLEGPPAGIMPPGHPFQGWERWYDKDGIEHMTWPPRTKG